MATEAYDATKLNRIGRMPDRARYDHETVHAIIRDCPCVHVGFIDQDSLPQVVPMVAALDDGDDGLFLILHGYHNARFIKLTEEKGTPLVVTATFHDGIVLALSAFHHSINYRSATLHGFSDPLDPSDVKGKERAARLVVDSIVPGRWDACRQPTAAELQSTGFTRMRIETGSAKVRTGMPKDDKADMEDDGLVQRVWAGVVPLSLAFGQAQATPTNRAPLPDFVKAVTRREL